MSNELETKSSIETDSFETNLTSKKKKARIKPSRADRIMGDADKPVFNWGYLSKYREYLTGISILSIMIFHYFEDVRGYGPKHDVYQLGLLQNDLFSSTGVEWFLFLSGFGLCYYWKNNNSLRDFYGRRFRKVLIPYLAIGFVFYMLRDVFLANGGVSTAGLALVPLGTRLLHVVADLSFVSFLFRGDRAMWYIFLIILMYLLFPLMHKMVNTNITRFRLQNVFFFVVMITLFHVMNEAFPEFWADTEIAWTRILVFYFGICFADAIHKNRRLTAFDVSFFVFGFLYKIAVMDNRLEIGDTDRVATSVYAISLLVFVTFIIYYFDQLSAVVRINPEANVIFRFFRWCGKMSLELYLIHVALRTLFNEVKFSTYMLGNYMSVLVLSFLAAIIIDLSREYRRERNIKKSRGLEG